MNDAARPDGSAAETPAAASAPAGAGDDSVLPFQLDALALRGRVARLDATLEKILSQHAYPPSVCALVGQATLLTALIGQAMKLRHRFSLQARSEDSAAPVNLIATDYFAPAQEGGVAEIRAYARFDAEKTPETAAEPHKLMGEGLFAMIIDQGPHMAPYQGVTPLTEKGLVDSAETYFAQSEQVATRFHLAVGQTTTPGRAGPHWRAGGVMLQHLAQVGEAADAEAARGLAAAEAQEAGPQRLMTAEDVAAVSDHADAWRTAVLKLDTAEEIELIGPHVTPERLLVRLFHEDAPRVYPAQKIAFGCTCSAQKVVSLMKSYPIAAVEEMATDAGLIEADCQFCGARYVFTVAELTEDAARK